MNGAPKGARNDYDSPDGGKSLLATMSASQNSGRVTSNSTSAPFVELHHSLARRAADISRFVDQIMGSLSCSWENLVSRKGLKKKLKSPYSKLSATP